MSRVYLSPGVYVKEKDISDLIPAVATTSAALVGYSKKGDLGLTLITNSQQFISHFGEPTPGNYFHYTALAFLEQGNTLWCRRVRNSNNSTLYAGANIKEDGSANPNAAFAAGTVDKTEAYCCDSLETDTLFCIFARNPGEWGNRISVKVKNVVQTYYLDLNGDVDFTRAADVTDQYTFEIEVWWENDDGVDEKVETWKVSRKTKIDGNGIQLYLEDRINEYSDYIWVVDNPYMVDTELPKPDTTAFNLGGGADGDTPGAGDYVTAWGDFENPDNIDIRILLNGGLTALAVQNEMKRIAEARMDCIAILDMPYTQISSVSNMINWRNATQNINSSYTALYAPWVKMHDPYSDKVVEVPPSGYIGAQFAYNDYVSDVWYAPAGFNRGQLNILSITSVFTQGERDNLYESQINPLQTFRGQGNVIWGQRTQQWKRSALSSVNVRRLLIIIEKALAVALRSFAFEPNSELTRFRVVSMIEEYMDTLSAAGAFQTEGGDKGYAVVCDENNNTPAIIDSNELHVDLFVKPSRAAEFIQLQTIITSTGASFEELVAKGVMF